MSTLNCETLSCEAPAMAVSVNDAAKSGTLNRAFQLGRSKKL